MSLLIICSYPSVSVLGVDIAQCVQSKLLSLGLNMSMCRGQAYDGGSNMSGSVNGCAAVIKRKHPLAIYSHCHSHKLNLALMKACTHVTEISTLFLK